MDMIIGNGQIATVLGHGKMEQRMLENGKTVNFMEQELYGLVIQSMVKVDMLGNL